MKILICLLFTFLYQNVAGRLRVDPLVSTKAGLIRGLRSDDGDYAMFLGIPYARVNADNPFGAALPVPEFETTFEANDDSVTCPQILSGTVIGDLYDCLRLNVYVPSSAHANNRLPVLVWLHGGGFTMGSGNRERSNPKFLLKHDIIYVSFNYRLGPYGFMCLGTPEVPGNQGFKDQVKALRWLQENIEAFGGDKTRITLFGESAGAMAADTHLFSDTENLFSGVILNSGTAFIPEIGSDPDPEAAIKLAQFLGYNANDVTQALSFLERSDPALVVAAAQHLDRFFPCVEKEFEGVESFLTEFPMNKKSKANDVAILIGMNSDECVLCFDDQFDDDYYNNFTAFESSLLMAFNFNDEQLSEMIEIMKLFYIGDEEASARLRYELSEFESDFKFVFPALRSVEHHLKSGANQIFYYEFSYDGGRSMLKYLDNVTFEGKVVHADDLGYLFDMDTIDFGEPSAEDQLMIDRMTTMWTNFVKYRDPTPETSELLPVRWQPITNGSPHYYMNIDLQAWMSSRPFHERTAFWELFYDYNKKYLKGYQEH